MNFPDVWQTDISEWSNKSAAIVFAVFDENGVLLWANSGMKTLLGMEDGNINPAEWLLNPNFKALICSSESDAPVFEGILTAGNGKDIFRSVIAKVFHKYGQVFIAGEYDVMELDRVSRQMVDLNRQISNLQRDLIKEKTMLEKTLKELRETQAMLIHSEKMNAMGKLVAGIAHEINNPIAFVNSNLYSLKDAMLDITTAYSGLESLIQKNGTNKMKTEAANIRETNDIDFIMDDFDDLFSATIDGVRRVTKIVRDLHTFSRLDEAEIKTVDLQECIKSTISLVSPELKKRKIEVRLRLSDLPMVSCSPSELNQVFMNLIINAAQAMDNGGTLEINGKAENGNICLEFADTGVGIPAEIMDKIFDPFFTTKPVGAGTGLGLSLVYRIITEKHQGTVSVKSKEDEGTVFYITIPEKNEE